MSDFLQLMLVLAVLIGAAKLAGLLSLRLGQPAVLGELLAGVVLGPSLLNVLHAPFLPSEHLEATIIELAELGVVFLMFIAGLEIDLQEMRRSGMIAAVSGTFGVVAPMVLGSMTAVAFGYTWLQGIFIGIIMAATSVSISAQTLMELGKLRSRVGVTLLGAAVFDDVLGILVLSLFVALVQGGGGGWLDVGFTVLRMALFLGGAAILGSRVIPWLVDRVARWQISQPVLATAIVVTLLLSWAAEYVGAVAAITGSFLAGVLFARSSHHQQINRNIQGLAYGLLVPIFFVSIGLRTDTHLLGGNALLLTVCICVVAIISKIIGCGLGARICGMNNRESLQLGIGMISRGEVGLIVATVGIGQAIIHDEIFAVTVVMVLVTTLVTPVLLRLAFRDRRQVAEPEPVTHASD